MEAALYHPWIYLTGGAERVLVELLDRSRHDWTVYTHHLARATTFPELGRHRVVELRPRASVRRSLVPVAAAAVTMAATALPEGRERVLLVSSEGLGDLVALRARVPVASYCHTPLKIVHDDEAALRLSATRPAAAVTARLLAPAFGAADRRAWRRYRHAFVNSEETRRRVTRAGLVPGGPIEVAHPGVDTARFRPGGRPEPGCFLVAGRIMWQKRVELAVDGLRRAVEAGARARLVVAGAVDAKSRGYLADLRQRAAGLPVRFEVDPTDDRLIDLYRAATAVLFTPPAEDFGIVPLEAMACGAPVVAVDAAGPRETVEHGVSGWLVPPTAVAFAERIRRLTDDPVESQRLRPAAVRRAAAFGWDRLVTRVDDVVEELGAGTGPPPTVSRDRARPAGRWRRRPTSRPGASPV